LQTQCVGGTRMLRTLLLPICLVSLRVLVEAQEDEEEQRHHIERRWADMPNVTFTFDCTDRPIGFYADLEFDCMIFHMCDEDGRRIPYMCGNNTSFNQKFRVCDWNYNVDCPNSPDWYYLNDLTYRTDPPPPAEEERRGRSRDLSEQDFVLDEDNIRK